MKNTYYYWFLLLILISSVVFTTENTFAKEVNNSNFQTLFPSPQVAYNTGNKTFEFNSSTKISILVNQINLDAIANDLKIQFKKITTKDLEIKQDNGNSEVNNSIALGLYSTIPLNKWLQDKLLQDFDTSKAESFFIDCDSTKIAIIAKDSATLVYALDDFIKFVEFNYKSNQLSSFRIFDYPDYPKRWIYSAHNLRGANAMTELEKIAANMKSYRMNGIQQNDWKYNALDEQPNFYFDSVARFRKMCKDNQLEIIPGVCSIGWSNGLLFNNPNLAEGMPSESKFIVEQNQCRQVDDSPIVFPNASFENINSSNKFTGFSWYDENVASQDLTVSHSGKASAKCTNFDGSNSRFNKTFVVKQNHGYVFSAWCKSENLNPNSVNLLVLAQKPDGKYRSLTSTAIDIPKTSNWTKVEVVFNSLEYTNLALYVGVWGASSGTIWWDDIEVKEIGLFDILRRQGCPLEITNLRNKAVLKEKIDFDSLYDSKMLSQRGDYGPYHTAPDLKIISFKNVSIGDTLLVKSYHPYTAVSDKDGNGSTMVCPSDPALYDLLYHTSNSVYNLYKNTSFMMGHDEIRNFGWDKSCKDRNLSAADILADNLIKCDSILNLSSPNLQKYVWSDMFDSLHNAHDEYYMINGDLTGIWNKIPKHISIVNWNGGNASKSLNFFNKLGFSQITSPYYDTKDASNIRAWRKAQAGISNIDGMMYTTWQNDYSYLKEFAYNTWNCGPNIFHTPINENDLEDSVISFTFNLFDFAFDNFQANTKLEYQITKNNGEIIKDSIVQKVSTNKDKIEKFSLATKDIKSIKYRLQASNSRAVDRYSPYYTVSRKNISNIETIGTSLTQFGLKIENKQLFLNKISNSQTQEMAQEKYQIDKYQIELYDFSSKLCFSQSNVQIDFSQIRICDLSNLSNGVYFLKIQSKNGWQTISFILN